MRTKIIEATNNNLNWGKFMLGQFDEEWMHVSEVNKPALLLHAIGTNPSCIWVFDLQTRESAMFRPGGYAKDDLNKHRIWVCPLFEPFLEWLYQCPTPLDFESLPSFVQLPEAEFAFRGYRREGP